MTPEPGPRPLLKPAADDGGLRRRLALTLGLLGLLSIFMVFGIDAARDRIARRDIGAVRSAAEIRLGVATSHLWMEQLTSGDRVDPQEIWHGLRHALSLATALSGGAETLDGGWRITEVADASLRAEAAAIERLLQRFSESTLARQNANERGEAVRAGSITDAAYDQQFREIEARTELFQQHAEALLASRQQRFGLYLLAVLAVWAALVALAIFGLQRFERRRVSAEAALRDRDLQLVQAQKMDAVGRLAGGVAHDINNYLAAIRAQCELMLRKEMAEPRRHEKLTAAISAVDRASTLIQRLLAFARRQPAHPEVVDLNQIVRGLRPMLEQHLGEDVRLDVRLRDALGRTRIDPAQVEQILVNLVVNARDAMPRGGVLTIETDQEVFAAADPRRGPVSQAGEYVILSVSDTGGGVPAEIRDQIFEPFFTTKAGKGNSGLGLATIYGIVKQNGGNVRLFDAPFAGGNGACFKIYLPRVVAAEAPPHLASAPSQGLALPAGTHVLLVEDHAEVRESTRSLLEAAGFRVVAAASGREALASEIHVDIVVTDVVMPGMSGPDMVSALRRERGPVPVVFMSGYSESVAGVRGFLAPGTELLQKPFSAEQLLAKMQQAVQSHRAGS